MTFVSNTDEGKYMFLIKKFSRSLKILQKTTKQKTWNLENN